MTLEAHVLTDDSLHATEGGCAVAVRLPWYRSLPLSCVEDVILTVDGERVAREDVRVAYGSDPESAVSLDDLADRTEQWFVQDAVQVHAPLRSVSVHAGQEAEVEVTLAVRVPYIMIGPETALVQHTRVARKVVAR